VKDLMAFNLSAADQPAEPVRRPLAKKSGYLPSLDGWRAVAILAVLMVHDTAWRLGRYSNQGYQRFGGFGVELFFAISGFLVCTRILEEEAAVGHFRLKSFYIRRFFRIQPASLAYLFVIAVLLTFGVIPESWHYWFAALLQYANYASHALDTSGKAAFTGHFWTLAVEEHFYILLSLLLFFFRKHRILIFAAVIVAIRLAQVVIRHHGGYGLDSIRQTQWNILYLLTPSLLALLLRVPEVRSLTERLLQPWVAYLTTAALMLLGRLQYCPSGHYWVAGEIMQDQAPYLYFGFALWVIATALHPHSWSTRLLEWPVLKFFGRLSYSIYLWHVLFFVLAYDPSGVTWHPILFLTERPWKYIASLAAALISYYFIEKPMIRLGHRLAPPVTPGHTDLKASTT
jgi:peptidoglycan/LPS O-acetylase OafA/YrhL